LFACCTEELLSYVNTSTPDWSKADDYSLLRYETVLNKVLPVSVLLLIMLMFQTVKH